MAAHDRRGAAPKERLRKQTSPTGARPKNATGHAGGTVRPTTPPRYRSQHGGNRDKPSPLPGRHRRDTTTGMAWGTTTNGDGSRHVEACIAEVRLHLTGHPRELAMFNNHLDLEPDAKDLIDVCNAVLQDTTGRTRQIIAEADDALLNRHLKQPKPPDDPPKEHVPPPPLPSGHWIIEKLKALSPKALMEWTLVFFVVGLVAIAALVNAVLTRRDRSVDIDLGRNTVRDIPDPKEFVGTLWMIEATNPPQYLIAPPYAQRQLACSAFDDPGNLLCLAPPSRRGTRAFDLRLGRNIAVETTAGAAPPKPSNDPRWRASSEPPGHQTHTVVGNLYLIPATAPPQYLVRYLDSERSNVVLHCQAHEKAPQAAAYANAPTGDARDAAKLEAAAQIRCQPFRINPALQAGTYFDVSRGVVARAPDDLAAAPLPVQTFLQALPADLRYNGLFIGDDPPYQERR